MDRPRHCRPEAFDSLRDALERLETNDGLVQAAVAVSMHEMGAGGAEEVDAKLEEYAAIVRKRVRSGSEEALLAHLHEVLFEDARLAGNVEDYYNPMNSYLPAVLASRRGLPIILTLIYKVVGERAGLKVDGINAPLHFMAGVVIGGKQVLVDPFFGGRVLSREEAFERIEAAAGQAMPRVDQVLPVATHRQWILRIIQNLVHAFERRGNEHHHRAMLEMRQLVLARPV